MNFILKKQVTFYFLLYFLLSFLFLKAEEIKSDEDILVDLREPTYENGTLRTEKGGVISGPQLRIQAQTIYYQRTLQKNNLIHMITAEGQLIVEFGEYTFTGSQLFYDFVKKEGYIKQGKTSVEPWYLAGETIELLSNGDYIVYQASLTTSENKHPAWRIQAQQVELKQKQLLKAHDVHLYTFEYPILWIPSLKANLNSIFDSPIRYRFRWGGKLGPRIGLTYEVFSWEQWKVFLRLDYRFTRGPGAGIELYYMSPDHRTSFESVNYLAKDSSVFNLHEKARYRFEGVLRKIMSDDKVTLLLTYDKVSDIDLPSNYYDQDFDFQVSKRTQLLVRRQEEDWIGEFYTRVRVNNFQTVKQELPSLSLSMRPYTLGQTGIIYENNATASYFDFKYSNHLMDVSNYASSRIEYRPLLYRPFKWNHLTFTPELGGVAIFYGNSPHHTTEWLLSALTGAEMHTQLYRCYGPLKHVIQPYVKYQYYTCPTSSPCQHFIFDINDGWYSLNRATVGLKNSIYLKQNKDCINRIIFVDVYTHAFFDTQRFRTLFPKMYGQLTFFTLPTVRHTIDTAWDFENQRLDHFNFRSQLTLHSDFAIAVELRHRDSFSWRKVDQDNFFLELFHSEKSLRHSSLSDRRDTLLMHLFYRFHPNWAFELEARQGWNRLKEPNYTEYELNLLTTFQTAWHLRFSYQHTENDDRVAMYVNVGLKRPEPCKEQQRYCYD